MRRKNIEGEAADRCSDYGDSVAITRDIGAY